MYVAVNVIGASAAERSFWDQRRRASSRSMSVAAAPLPSILVPREVAIPIRLDLSNGAPDIVSKHPALSAIPGEAASVRRTHWGPAESPLVLYLQDVHQNAEAQKNLSRVTQSLIDAGTVDLVALEGAFSSINLMPLREFPDREALRQSADFLLRENKISGPVHGALVAEKPAPLLLGIDDPVHYNANVAAYQRTVSTSQTVRVRLAAEKKTIEEQKRRIFSTDLLDLDKIAEGYHDGTVPLGDYVRALARSGAKPPAPAARFLEALSLETALDFSQVETDRAQLMDRLAPRLTPDEGQRLINDTLAYRSGALGYGSFYSQLQSLCRSKGLVLSSPLQDYVRYTVLAQGIDAEALHDALPGYETNALRTLVQTSAQQDLVDKAHLLRLTNKLTNFAFTPSDWRDYRERPSRDPGLINFELFYREAESRDQTMASRVIEQIARSKARVVILVTGGFHAGGVERRLTEAGCSVVLMAPRLDRVDKEGGSAALSVFTRDKTPLQKLFAGQKLFLSPDPAAGLTETPALMAATAVRRGMSPIEAGRAALRAYNGAIHSVQLKWDKIKNQVRVQLVQRLEKQRNSRAVSLTVQFDQSSISTITFEPDPLVVIRELPYTLWSLVDKVFAEIFVDHHDPTRNAARDRRLWGLLQFIPLWTLGGIGLAIGIFEITIAMPGAFTGSIAATLAEGTLGALLGHVAGHLAYNKMFPWARLSLSRSNEDQSARVYISVLKKWFNRLNHKSPHYRTDLAAWYGETLLLESTQRESAKKLNELYSEIRAERKIDTAAVSEIIVAFSQVGVYENRALDILSEVADSMDRWQLQRLIVRLLKEPNNQSTDFILRVLTLAEALEKQADSSIKNHNAAHIILLVQREARVLERMGHLARSVNNPEARASAHLALARALASAEKWALAEEALRQSRNHGLEESAEDRALLVNIVLNSADPAGLLDWIEIDSPDQSVPRLAAVGRAIKESSGDTAAIPVYLRAWNGIPGARRMEGDPQNLTVAGVILFHARSIPVSIDQGGFDSIHKCIVEELVHEGLFVDAGHFLLRLKNQYPAVFDELSEWVAQEGLVQGQTPDTVKNLIDPTTDKGNEEQILRLVADVVGRVDQYNLRFFLAGLGYYWLDGKAPPPRPGDPGSNVNLARILAATKDPSDRIGVILMAAARTELLETDRHKALDLLLNHSELTPYLAPFVEAQQGSINTTRFFKTSQVLASALRRGVPGINETFRLSQIRDPKELLLGDQAGSTRQEWPMLSLVSDNHGPSGHKESPLAELHPISNTDRALIDSAAKEWGPPVEVALNKLKAASHPADTYNGFAQSLNEGRVLVIRPSLELYPEQPAARLTTLGHFAHELAQALTRSGRRDRTGELEKVLKALLILSYIEGNGADSDRPIILGMDPKGLIKIWDAGVKFDDGVIDYLKKHEPAIHLSVAEQKKLLEDHGGLTFREMGPQDTIPIVLRGRKQFFHLNVRHSELNALEKKCEAISLQGWPLFDIQAPAQWEDIDEILKNVPQYYPLLCRLSMIDWPRQRDGKPTNRISEVTQVLFDFIGGDPEKELETLFTTLNSNGFLREPFYVRFDRVEGQPTVTLYGLPFPGQTTVLGEEEGSGPSDFEQRQRPRGTQKLKVVPAPGPATNQNQSGAPTQVTNRNPQLAVAPSAFPVIPMHGKQYRISHLRETPGSLLGFVLTLRPPPTSDGSPSPGNGPTPGGSENAARDLAKAMVLSRNGGSVSAKELKAILPRAHLGVAGDSLINQWAAVAADPTFTQALGRELTARSLSLTWLEAVSFIAESIWGRRTLSTAFMDPASGVRPLDVILVNESNASRLPDLLKSALSNNRNGTVVLSGLDAAGRSAIKRADQTTQCLTIPAGSWLTEGEGPPPDKTRRSRTGPGRPGLPVPNPVHLLPTGGPRNGID
jgi:hypothetical protein